MLGHVAALQALEFEVETAHAELSTSFGDRVACIGTLDTSRLVEKLEPAGNIEQYRGAGSAPVPMTQEGEFEFTIDLKGHGSTTEGSPNASQTDDLIAWIFGMAAPDLSLATSQTLTGGTVDAPTTSGANGADAGGLLALGTAGDGDGEGLVYPISAHTGSALAMLVELLGAPANGALMRGVFQFYFPSSPTSSDVPTARFRLLSANMQYAAHGCAPKAIRIAGTGPGGRPQLTVTVGVARWGEVNVTFPSTATEDRVVPAPTAAGSVHVQLAGTADRNEIVCHDFQIEIGLAVEAVRGFGGVSSKQDIIGWKRGLDTMRISLLVGADATTTTPVFPTWAREGAELSVMVNLNRSVGKQVSFWFPKLCLDVVPVQMADQGINRFRVSGIPYTSDVLTTELTRARMVMGLS